MKVGEEVPDEIRDLFEDTYGDTYTYQYEWWFRSGAGVELRADLHVAYNIDVSGRLGWAEGLGEGGISMFYLEIGTSF